MTSTEVIINKKTYDNLVSWIELEKIDLGVKEKIWLDQFKDYLTMAPGPKKDNAEFFARCIIDQARKQGFSAEKDYSAETLNRAKAKPFIKRRSIREIIESQDPNFLIIRYPDKNNTTVEYPIPIKKINELEVLLNIKKSMSIESIMSELRFRKEDEIPLLELMKQMGHTVYGTNIILKK